EAKHDPALLFNIGQAYRFAGDLPKAIGAFKSYLRRMPKAPNRPEVEARIAEMQKLLDEQKQGQSKPPAGTLAPDGRPLPEPQKTEPQKAEPQPAPQPTPPPGQNV